MAKIWTIKKVNKRYFLKKGKRIFYCQLGESGMQIPSRKIEGDKTTPIGKWKLTSLYFRKDKVLRSHFKKNLPMQVRQITKYCGWCDDVLSKDYNKYIKIKSLFLKGNNCEKLWREDDAYDIVINTSYNLKPTIKNKGSAIFVHCSFSDNRNTAGCIALKKKDLIFLLKNFKGGTYIDIKK